MKKLSYLFYALCFSLISCHVNDLNFHDVTGSISPNIAIAIGTKQYTVLELLQDLEDESLSIEEGSDMSMSIYFSDTAVFSDNKSLISVESIVNNEEFAPGQNLVVPPAGHVINITEEFLFEFPATNGERIDSVYFNAGTLDYVMKSSFKGDIQYTWVIEGTKEVSTNQNITKTVSVDYTDTTPTSDTYSRPLSGLKSKMYKNGTSNEFKVKITGTITFMQGVVILPSDKMTFRLSYTEPGFSQVYGFFGTDPISVQSESVDMSAFSEFGGDGLKLSKPSIQLTATNSYGLGIDLVFNNIKAIKADKSEIMLIEKNPPSIDGFISPATVMGKGKQTTVLINTTNSNIDCLLNYTPVSLEFSIGGNPNPPPITASDQNFLSDESEIKMITSIIMPLTLQMNGFTTEFDFDAFDIEGAGSLTFNVTTTNQIPFSGVIDLKFVDVLGDTIYTIPNAVAIGSPDVDSKGKTIAPKITDASVALDQVGIEAFVKTDKILATAKISTFEVRKKR